MNAGTAVIAALYAWLCFAAAEATYDDHHSAWMWLSLVVTGVQFALVSVAALARTV